MSLYPLPKYVTICHCIHYKICQKCRCIHYLIHGTQNMSLYLIPGPEKIQWHRTLQSKHCAMGMGTEVTPFFGALIFFLATTNTNCQRRRPAEEDGDIGWRVAVAVLWVEDRRCYSEEPEHFLDLRQLLLQLLPTITVLLFVHHHDQQHHLSMLMATRWKMEEVEQTTSIAR